MEKRSSLFVGSVGDGANESFIVSAPGFFPTGIFELTPASFLHEISCRNLLVVHEEKKFNHDLY